VITKRANKYKSQLIDLGFDKNRLEAIVVSFKKLFNVAVGLDVSEGAK
jgi:hypothetical protein